MKKLMIVLLTLIAFSSCTKKSDCKCGIIYDDEIESGSNFNLLYTLTIKNDCSGNTKKFYLNQNDWMNGIVGEPYCMDVIW